MASLTTVHDGVPSVEELLLKCSRQIRRIIERRSGDLILKHVTVDDLYQETASAALAGAGGFRFEGEARFLGWIETILRRIIASQLRDRRRGPGIVRIRRAASSGVGVRESGLGSPGRTPSSSAAGHEAEDRLKGALGQLPEHYRQVLTLYKLEERPLAEVAGRMNRTKGATCRLLARALERLRSNLEE